MQFTLDAVNKPDPFAVVKDIPPDVQDAIRWLSERSPSQIIHEREIIMQKLEKRAKQMWSVWVNCVIL